MQNRQRVWLSIDGMSLDEQLRQLVHVAIYKFEEDAICSRIPAVAHQFPVDAFRWIVPH